MVSGDKKESIQEKKNKILKPCKQRFYRYKIHGFDIETFDKNRRLLMSSFYLENGIDFIHIRQNMFMYCLKHCRQFKNSLIAATNMGFDFFGSFFPTGEIQRFKTMFRGSHLIFADTFVIRNEFSYDSSYIDNRKQFNHLKFIDTMNYSMMGVKRIGDFLKLPKLDAKEIIARIPVNEDEWKSMIAYNLRDAEISVTYLKFLKNSFEMLGATFKDTIASTAMSLFRNQYLDNVYFTHDVEDLLEIFQAFYGGRCEMFKRGKIEDYNYYDFCSLYPSVMHDNSFPNPNSHRISHENSTQYIMMYEGVSKVDVYIPNMRVPVLPVKLENKKVLFPCGELSGWYSHVELRKAMELGCKIMKVHKTHYYKSNCTPFKSFVKDLYEKRLAYQKEKSPIQEVVKILMNCFSSDTQIWTENGIKYIKDVVAGEKVYSINPDTLEVSLKLVIKTWKYPHKGKMFQAKNTKGVDLLTTMNHRFLMKRWYEKKYNFVLPNDMMNAGNIEWQFPSFDNPIKGLIQDFFILGEYKFKMNDWLEFLGWYISEGSCNYYEKCNNYRITIHQQKQNYRDEIKSLFERMGFVRRKKNSHKPYELSYYMDDTTFIISSELIYKWLDEKCNQKSKNLRIPSEYFYLDHTHLNYLFDSMMKGDGCLSTQSEKSYQMMKYTTISKNLAEDFSRLCLHMGLKSRVFNEGKTSKLSDNDIFRVFIYRYKYSSLRKNRNHMNIVDYDDFVYCVSLDENNTVLAGRNGNFQFLGQSLFGKFCQKFKGLENFYPEGLINMDKLNKCTVLERVGNFVRVSEDFTDPMPYCIPIWGIYVTAYGRLKLHDMLMKYDPVYCDTDSIITKHEIASSNELGKLKLEMTIKEGIIIKPKFYGLIGNKGGEDVEEIKIKGFSRAVSELNVSGVMLDLKGRKKNFINFKELIMFLGNPIVRYNKFIKPKEAIRRKMLPNEEIMTHKQFTLEDDKRMWREKFDHRKLQDSHALIIKMNVTSTNTDKNKDLLSTKSQDVPGSTPEKKPESPL